MNEDIHLLDIIFYEQLIDNPIRQRVKEALVNPLQAHAALLPY